MNTPMTDKEVFEYAERFVSYLDENGTISKEGVDFLIENVPSLDDQERIIAAVKDIKANDDARETEDDQEGRPEEASAEAPAEAEAPVEADTVEVTGELV